MNRNLTTLAAALALAGLSSASLAHTVSGETGIPGDGGGLNYAFNMEVHNDHGPNTQQFDGSTGSQAYSDPSIGGDGWTHNSQWGYINLHAAGTVIFSLSRPTGSSLVPGFYLWSGYDNSGAGPDHTFPPPSPPDGIDGLGAYLGGPTAAPNGTLASITLNLAAGAYTVALGGNSATGNGFQPYHFQVSAVPVPAAVWLFGSALAGMGVFGRRKSSAKI